MAKINQNTLAQQIAAVESGKEEVNIAQIKEVLRRTLDVLAQEYQMSEVLKLIEEHSKSL